MQLRVINLLKINNPIPPALQSNAGEILDKNKNIFLFLVLNEIKKLIVFYLILVFINR
jgi:hypothetical protein